MMKIKNRRARSFGFHDGFPQFVSILFGILGGTLIVAMAYVLAFLVFSL